MKKSFLLIFAALLPLVVSAQTKVKIGGFWYNLDLETKQAEVTYKGDHPLDYDEYSGSLYLAAPIINYNNEIYSVTGIGDEAFAASSLTSLTIPNRLKITSIGDGAFSMCMGLTSFNIPESVTNIGDKVFLGCFNLESVNIPVGVTSIGDAVFEYCSSLTAITIPESVTSIGIGAFAGCSSLTAIAIPEGVKSIGMSAFSSCSNLTAITIPAGVTSIGNRVLAFCNNIASMIVDENNAYYDSRDGCNGIVETATNTLIAASESTIIPASVTSIGDAVFSGRSGLTTIDIPMGVTSIGDEAFASSGLITIILPEGVTSIGETAFIGCTNLTSINIPKSVTNIGSGIFSGCGSLKHVYCHAEEVPSSGGFWFTEVSEHATLHVPANALEAYKSDASWGSFPNIVALTEDETGIGRLANGDSEMTIYDLHGRRITDAEGLKGVYIVNGSKTVIK